jgi:hypothetical protein
MIAPATEYFELIEIKWSNMVSEDNSRWLPLNDAMFTFCDAELVAAYKVAKINAIHAIHTFSGTNFDFWKSGDNFDEARWHLSKDFKRKFVEFKLKFRGVLDRPTKELSECDISTARLDEFILNPEENCIDCGNYRFINVSVLATIQDKSTCADAVVRPNFSHETCRAWCDRRVREWPPDQKPPSGAKCLNAARLHFADGKVPRDRFLEIRNEVVPVAWRKPGPRGRKISGA